MKTKTSVKVIPYGQTAYLLGAVPKRVASRRVSPTLAQGSFKTAVVMVFSSDLDDSFAEFFKANASAETKVIVLHDSANADRLASKLVDLQLRSSRRFCVVPAGTQNRKVSRDLVSSLITRVDATSDLVGEKRILHAAVSERNLQLVATDFSKAEVPLVKLTGLATASEAKLQDFEVDDEGAFVYWPQLDLHLGWDQLQQVIDPEKARKAKQKSHSFNVRFGAALRKFREGKNVAASAIPGLSEKQLQRIERGECRLTSNAAQILARCFQTTATELLNAVSDRLDQ